ncbi:MAG TPA: hypothetical protein VFK32_06195 [Tepidiformaceae bacterium]|nr:hypothetical protein [Tepidiformaceae bacterium]
MTTLELAHDCQARVRTLLATAGPRGASHEDFVEAGLAPGYIDALRRLAGDGLDIQTDFTTGTPRWTLVSAV